MTRPEPVIDIDLFAGPGGWDEGAAPLGIHPLGIERDEAACATRRAAGHETLQADVAALEVATLAAIRGLIGSPPCKLYSAAGTGIGRLVIDVLAGAIPRLLAGEDCRGEVRERVYPVALGHRHGENEAREPSKQWTAERVEAAARSDAFEASLVLEPARYIAGIGKSLQWVALEQVSAVLPLWRVYAAELRKAGFNAWSGKLNAADYGIISMCPLHDTNSPIVNAESAEHLSRHATALASAPGFATTRPDAQALKLAVTVAARWASRIRQAFAGSATCAGREQALVALAESVDRITLTGTADAAWTSEATSGYGLTPATVASIASLLSSFLDALSPEEKSCITSTETRRTIVQAISRCIAATLITGPGTGPASRTAGCGLCVDHSVPQTRERAILIASRVRRVSRPTPTHYDPRKGEQLFGRPWTSMAEALGWGATGRPVPTVTAGGTSTGGAEPFGHRGRDALEAELSEGRWALRRSRGEGMLDREGRGGRRDHPGGEPAPTITSGGSKVGANLRWVMRRQVGACRQEGRRDHELDEPAPTITVQEAAILQSFPADYPWQGTKTAQFTQVGNAVPPLLALHVLSMATGIPLPESVTGGLAA